jgi:hypothetical protein
MTPAPGSPIPHNGLRARGFFLGDTMINPDSYNKLILRLINRYQPNTIWLSPDAKLYVANTMYECVLYYLHKYEPLGVL